MFLSSHIISELEPVCDNLIILSSSSVRLSGSIEDLLATHHVLVGPRRSHAPSDVEIVSARHAELQSTLLVHGKPTEVGPAWQVLEPDLDEIVLAYLDAQPDDSSDQTKNEGGGVVIWLVFRRYRVLMAITVVALVGLAVWMILLGHASDVAESSFACTHGTFECSTRSGVFSLSDQATAINFLLLLIPCLLGVVFGAPLVAGELEHSTNRLAWTQGVSRTKWLIVKWAAVGLFLVVLARCADLRFPMVDRASGRVPEPQSLAWPGSARGRLQPLYFPITGLALSAYTLFAFALSAALGAAIRKTSWAVFGAVIAYTAVAVTGGLLHTARAGAAGLCTFRDDDIRLRRGVGWCDLR